MNAKFAGRSVAELHTLAATLLSAPSPNLSNLLLLLQHVEVRRAWAVTTAAALLAKQPDLSRAERLELWSISTPLRNEHSRKVFVILAIDWRRMILKGVLANPAKPFPKSLIDLCLTFPGKNQIGSDWQNGFNSEEKLLFSQFDTTFRPFVGAVGVKREPEKTLIGYDLNLDQVVAATRPYLHAALKDVASVEQMIDVLAAVPLVSPASPTCPEKVIPVQMDPPIDEEASLEYVGSDPRLPPVASTSMLPVNIAIPTPPVEVVVAKPPTPAVVPTLPLETVVSELPMKAPVPMLARETVVPERPVEAAFANALLKVVAPTPHFKVVAAPHLPRLPSPADLAPRGPPPYVPPPTLIASKNGPFSLSHPSSTQRDTPRASPSLPGFIPSSRRATPIPAPDSSVSTTSAAPNSRAVREAQRIRDKLNARMEKKAKELAALRRQSAPEPPLREREKEEEVAVQAGSKENGKPRRETMGDFGGFESVPLRAEETVGLVSEKEKEAMQEEVVLQEVVAVQEEAVAQMEVEMETERVQEIIPRGGSLGVTSPAPVLEVPILEAAVSGVIVPAQEPMVELLIVEEVTSVQIDVQMETALGDLEEAASRSHDDSATMEDILSSDMGLH